MHYKFISIFQGIKIWFKSHNELVLNRYINTDYYKKIGKLYRLKSENIRFGIMIFNAVYTMNNITPRDVIPHNITNLSGNESILSF